MTERPMAAGAGHRLRATVRRLSAGPRPRAAVVVALLSVALLSAACFPKVGTNAPIDWAAEMHYSQTVRYQEPPRLSAPTGAVPVTGRAPARAPADYGALTNPVPATAASRSVGAELFRVNCSMCHGPVGLGDGQMASFLKKSNYIAPPNLTLPATVAKSDGDLFGILTNGIFVMPTFRSLLSPDERWLIVSHVRSLQDR